MQITGLAYSRYCVTTFIRQKRQNVYLRRRLTGRQIRKKYERQMQTHARSND